MSKLVFTVEDTFMIQGRGLVLVPGISINATVRKGDSVLLIRPDGTEVRSCIGSIERLTGTGDQSIPVVMLNLNKTDVPIGTEVWTTD